MDSELAPRPDVRERGARRLAYAGVALLAACPIVVFGGAALGMWHSFDVIESTKSPTPGELFGGVRISIGAWLTGAVLAAIGVGLLIAALLRFGLLEHAARGRGAEARS